jgi:hypothetical protein
MGSHTWARQGSEYGENEKEVLERLDSGVGRGGGRQRDLDGRDISDCSTLRWGGGGNSWESGRSQRDVVYLAADQ